MRNQHREVLNRFARTGPIVLIPTYFCVVYEYAGKEVLSKCY